MLKAVAARVYKAGVACILGVAFVLTPAEGQARNHPPTHGQTTIAVAQLPPQGRETYSLIHQGGPFPYDKDGNGLRQSRAVVACAQAWLLQIGRAHV